MDYGRDVNASEPYVGRRAFLSRSIATGVFAGLGSTIAAKDVMASESMADLPCRPSPADSLLLYLDLLIRVQSNAFYTASRGIISASKSCSDTLKKLQDQVKILQGEIQGPQKTTQVRQMNQALEFGQAQAQMIRASVHSSQNEQLMLANALSIVSNHISTVAQDLLPPGEITLTSKAKDALAEVIRLVRDFQQVPEETRLAQETYQAQVEKIRTDVEQMRNDLFAASAQATEAEIARSSSAAEQPRKDAADSIGRVICRLQSLKSAPPATEPCDASVVATAVLSQSPNAANPIDLMIAVLEGTRRLIQNPDLVSRIVGEPQGQPSFVPAVFNNASAAPLSIYSRVQNAINNTCPRGTALRTFWCIDLILGPLAFPDRGTRIPLIAGVLLLFPCWSGNKNALALALAEL